MNKLFIALSLMGLATTSFAYNGQVEGGYTFRDFDSNAVDTSGLFELKGTFYFENVNSKGPLNEAAFLGHNSNVYLGYGYDFTKFNPVLGQSTKYETNLLSAGIDGYNSDFPNSDDTRFAIQAKYVTPISNGNTINLEAAAEFGDIDEVRLGADYYFNPAFSAGIGYESIDYSNNTPDEDTFLIRSKYFINPNLAVGGAIGFGDNLNTYNINATLRF